MKMLTISLTLLALLASVSGFSQGNSLAYQESQNPNNNDYGILEFFHQKPNLDTFSDLNFVDNTANSQAGNSNSLSSVCCPPHLIILQNLSNNQTHVKEAEFTITATNTIFNGADAEYDAGDWVLLNPGFHAKDGSVCHVYIDGCSSTTSQCFSLDFVAIKSFLQGPYNPSTGLMNDDLRQAGLLPSSFGGSTITNTNVFNNTGNDAIVDWVSVELRPASNTNTISATRAALLQRDGDIVDVDGISPLYFDNLTAGDYHIVVTHRNHLSVMSNMTVSVN